MSNTILKYASILYVFCQSVIAEIIIDGSLNGHIVKPPGPNYAVTADLGQQRGGNLFHSFSIFDLTMGEQAIFSSGNGIQNIITRVTGGKASSINGTIKSDSASLWMINPAGWVFGPNVGINMNANSAFHVSTADNIRFDDGYFSANLGNHSKLTIKEPLGVSFLNPQKTAHITLNQSAIELKDKATFSIMASRVDINNANIKIPSGNVLIGAVDSTSHWDINSKGLNSLNQDLDFGLVNIINKTNIHNFNNKGINVSSNSELNRSGTIQIIAENSFLKNVRLLADTFGTGNQSAGNIYLDNKGNIDLIHTTIQADTIGSSDGRSGHIIVKANNLSMIEDSNISASNSADTLSEGQSGDINIMLLENLFLSGTGTQIESTVNGRGAGGTVLINAKNINLSDKAGIRAEASGSGSTGNIHIVAHRQINMQNGATISTSTNTITNNAHENQSDKGGLVDIKTDFLNLSGKDTLITSSSIGNNRGQHGNINIDAKGLYINNLAEIRALSENQSDGGNIEITNNQNLILNNGQITTSVTGGIQGNGGNINIYSDVLIMNTGLIQANTEATGSDTKGGEINIDTRALIASHNNLITDNKNIYRFRDLSTNGTEELDSDIITIDSGSGINVIQAASKNGLSGNITVTAPQLNISGELTNLKSEIVDIDQIAHNACTTPGTKQSTLINLSHGGLPDSPEQAGSLTLNPERLTQLLKVADIQKHTPDIPGSMITDQPNRQRLPPLEYPSSPQSQPDFTLPPAHSTPQSNQSLRFSVKQFRFSGNTVFSDKALQALAAPYRQRPITLADLETLRQQLTQHYIQHGYTHSAALLPEQVFSKGIIHFQIIEGRLTDIQVNGTGWLNSTYVRNRLQPNADSPLNAQALQARFQQLLNDPLIERMDARLIPGDTPEQNTLEVEVTRARPYQLSLGINNHSTPGIGAEEVRLDGWVHNLSGFGDRLGLSLGLTEGRFHVDSHFAIPLNRYDTQLSLRFVNSQADYIAGPLKRIKIKNAFRSYDLALTQPIHRNFKHNLTLAARLSVRKSRNELLGQGFQFGVGEKRDGTSRVSALRLTQEYRHSQPDQVLSFRSTFSLGLNLFNATWHPDDRPDGDYLAWLGQLQWARKVLDNGTQIRLRGNVQLTQDRLLSLERFALGGAYSVRGYRENERVSDMGYSLSAEFHYPLLNDHLLDAFPGTLTVIPFMDYGVAWNQKASQQRTVLHSLGMGLNWSYKHLNADFFYAHDLNTASKQPTYNLQDSGIHFRLTAALF